MPSSSNFVRRAAFTVVGALAISATLPSLAQAQRVDSLTSAPLRLPTARLGLRGEASTDSVRIDLADIESVTIPKSDLAARYRPWRGCDPIIVRVPSQGWTLESLLRLQFGQSAARPAADIAVAAVKARSLGYASPPPSSGGCARFGMLSGARLQLNESVLPHDRGDGQSPLGVVSG